jgi:large subunit ribosomal protein L18
VIDDSVGNTLASASTLEETLKGIKRNVEGAGKLGEEIGKRLKEKNVATVVFDRNGYQYHGIVKAIADGARKAGIAF